MRTCAFIAKIPANKIDGLTEIVQIQARVNNDIEFANYIELLGQIALEEIKAGNLQSWNSVEHFMYKPLLCTWVYEIRSD